MIHLFIDFKKHSDRILNSIIFFLYYIQITRTKHNLYLMDSKCCPGGKQQLGVHPDKIYCPYGVQGGYLLMAPLTLLCSPSLLEPNYS